MSDIARARAIIDKLLDDEMSNFMRKELRRARDLLDRERPEFKAPPTIRKLTPEEEAEACRLRGQGWPINGIARHLRTNIGRVSEAIKKNGRRPSGKDVDGV